MKVVLDTNVLLVSVSERSASHWVFEHFLLETYTLCITNEILLEYEEIFGREMGQKAAHSLMQILESSPNVARINTLFRWNLIAADPDDNKFVDCAIAASATYIVSEDSHFQVLKRMSFLPFDVLKIKDFKDRLRLNV
jgi:uncharacterized protein